MKASLKFRDDQKPLLKTKVPLKIFSLPFQSTLAAGESKELTLSLSTLFPSGPSFRVSYRPNDAFNPFCISIKSGLGPLGSPLSFSAHFNFVGTENGGISHSAPVFFLHFKPSFGDFVLKKKQRSTVDDFAHGGKGGVVGLKGVEVGARTEVRVGRRGVVRMRWGVKVPDGWGDTWKDGWGRAGVGPRLVLSKIGVEHVARVEGGKEEGKLVGPGGDVEELKCVVESESSAGGEVSLKKA